MTVMDKMFWAAFHSLRVLVLAVLSAFYPLAFIVLILIATVAAFNTLFMSWATGSWTSLPVLLSLGTATISAFLLMCYGWLLSLFAAD